MVFTLECDGLSTPRYTGIYDEADRAERSGTTTWKKGENVWLSTHYTVGWIDFSFFASWLFGKCGKVTLSQYEQLLFYNLYNLYGFRNV
jgi:hypothetical protein